MRAREQEAVAIAEINRAAAVGRLMMGRLLTSGWQDFLKDTEPAELSALPRQRLRGAVADVRKRLVGDVGQFCRENFSGMTVEKLAALHGAIKRTIPYGLRMPLVDFEKKFGAIRPKVLRDAPPHSTVWISL